MNFYSCVSVHWQLLCICKIMFKEIIHPKIKICWRLLTIKLSKMLFSEQIWRNLVVVDWYIAKGDISADIWYFSNIGIDQYFFLFGRCPRGGTFILTALKTALPEHTVLTFSLLFAVIVISSDTDRSLSNNQIELLNKEIKMYTKKYYKDCFYIISNRKANILILSRLPSAFSKYAFISFKQIFEWLMNI